MFDADRPIQTSAQDRLGRSMFAKYLARCILDHNSTDSLSIGLYGSWGAGKTSIINLMLEEIQFAANHMLDSEKPIVLNFSPWSYSGQNQLIYSFFRRLSAELRNATYLEHADRIIHLLELYVSFFTHQPVPKSLRPKHTIFTRILKPHLTKQEAFGWESGRDLTQVKAELNELLRKQKHKIIIIIDNIARIEDQEIKQIFQIVKSIGDYANTIYLLAMDKEHVVHAINKLQENNSGAAYLEKVVQLPFEIPPITAQDIENILLDRLNKIIDVAPIDTWNRTYWADLYDNMLKKLFVHYRDITRYINTLSFSFLRVKDIVNPVDFFAIVALQVFAPEVFYGIRDNKDLFTDLMDQVYEPDQTKLAEDKARIDEILQRSTRLSKESLQKLLIRLFPRLQSIYAMHVKKNYLEKPDQDLHRIYNPDVFDIYFRLSIPTSHISAGEMKAILTSTKDEEGFALALLRLNKDERIIPFLSMLDSDLLAHLNKQDIPNIINALLDSADLFPFGESNPLQFDTPMRIHRLICQLLSFIDPEKRYPIFLHAIQKAINSIYIITYELEAHTHDSYFSPLQLAELKKEAINKIKQWATIGRLQEHPRLIELLNAWRNWGDTDDCKRFITDITFNDQSLIAFLCAALKTPIDQAMTKFTKNPAWYDSLNTIENFISVQLLEHHVRMIFESDMFEKFREREQLAILIFLDLIGAKTNKIIPKTGA